MPEDRKADGQSNKQDARPEVAQDGHGKPRQKIKEEWKNTTDTMDEGPAGSPKAEEQSRKS
ncbi:hypothetical protein KUV61_02915 [Nocardioides marinus]|nr:hypothetical protein [Nocardioides marinus]